MLAGELENPSEVIVGGLEYGEHVRLIEAFTCTASRDSSGGSGGHRSVVGRIPLSTPRSAPYAPSGGWEKFEHLSRQVNLIFPVPLGVRFT
jgi:hypothetical protein